jgi:hypothetical protein
VALAILPASLLVLVSGFLIAARLPLRGALERLTATMLLTLAGITGLLLFAGAGLGSMDAWLILALAVLAFVAAFALSVGGAPRSWPDRLGRAGQQLRADLGRGLGVLRSEPLVAVLGLALLAALAWRSLLALRLPIHDFDGLAYHVVTVDVWLQNGHIGRVPQRIWSDSYAANGELITTWLMLLSRTDWLASFTGLIPLPLAAVAIAGFARTIGAERRWAALAGIVVIAMPTVIVKADSTYIDNLGMAEVAAAWFFALRAIATEEPQRRRGLLLLAGVAAGLAAGTKATLVLPVAGVGVAAFFAALLARRTPPAAKFLDAAALLVPSLVFGASWYIKNLVVFGNPLWPFTVGPFRGLGSFEEVGLRPPPEMAGLPPLQQIATSWIADLGYRTYSHDVRVGGYGLAWLPLLALAILAVAWLRPRRSALGLISVALPAIVTFIVMPEPWWTRYALFLVVLVAGLAALALSIARPFLGRVGGRAVAVLALASLVIANRTGNVQLHQGGSFHPSLVAMARLLVANEEARQHIWLWDDCRGFEALPAGARVRSDDFQLPHLLVGHDLSRQLLVPFKPGSDLRAAIAADRIVATHVVLTDPVDKAAARADPATFAPLGEVCRGAELFSVRGG